MKEVIVYSKNMCGYCTQEGHRTMPQIYIDGKSVGGYTELVKLDESAFN